MWISVSTLYAFFQKSGTFLKSTQVHTCVRETLCLDLENSVQCKLKNHNQDISLLTSFSLWGKSENSEA